MSDAGRPTAGPLVIVGTGAHARKVAQAALAGGWTLAGFADERPEAVSPLPAVPRVDAAAWAALSAGASVFVAIGAPAVRARLMDACVARGLRLPALVHPSAVVAPDADLAPGVLVAAGSVVETGSRIGRGAIVDIGVLVDHDCLVGEFTHLRPGQVCGPGSRWPDGA